MISEKIKFPYLKWVCRAAKDDFEYALGVKPEIVKDSYYSHYLKRNYTHNLHRYYKDNGSKILAVGHLDSVQEYTHFIPRRTKKGFAVFCPTLDDRLGVYTILDMLPRLGINVDILLTDGEESGMSTASTFYPDKEYNWIVEFDKQGASLTSYQYDNIFDYMSDEMIEVSDFGIYSDIVDLEHLGVCGINFGVGYHDYHNKEAYFLLREYYQMLELFQDFYHKHKDTKIIHSREIKETHYESGTYYYYNDDKVELKNVHNLRDYCSECGCDLNDPVFEEVFDIFTVAAAKNWGMCPDCYRFYQ